MKNDKIRLIIYAVIIGVITLLFWLFNIDMTVQSLLYDTTSKTWKFASNPFVLWLYKSGTFPAIILTVGAIIFLTLGVAFENLKKYRKASLLLVLLMFLGPGLITNVILKKYTGRPRPRDVASFGGRLEYKKPLQFATPGNGYSFPCGHCTMGFFFYGLYIIYRKKRKTAANIALVSAIVYGSAMGFGRMAQGGHFLSDVLWAGAIIFITAELLAIFIKPDDEDKVPVIPSKINKKLVTVIALILTVISALIFLIATPYSKYKEYSFGPTDKMAIISEHSDVSLVQSKKGFLILKAIGFGLPWSEYADEIQTEKQFIYKVSQKGIFSELSSSIDAGLPDSNFEAITITAGTGNIVITADLKSSNLYIKSEKGNITFRPESIIALTSLTIEALNGDVIVQLPVKTTFGINTNLIINAKSGNINIVNYSSYLGDLNKSAARISGAKEIIIKPIKLNGPQLKAAALKIVVEGVK